MKPIVSIIMGSTSDMPVMKQAAEFLDSMEIPFEINALSAHRVPVQVMQFATAAKERGIKVIIAGAGGAAHLPGVIAAYTPVPVIGVPIKSSNSMDGWDSVLSILQMPSGIPVATRHTCGDCRPRRGQERGYPCGSDYRNRGSGRDGKSRGLQDRPGLEDREGQPGAQGDQVQVQS